MKPRRRALLGLALAAAATLGRVRPARAGAQRYEPLAASVQAALSRAVSDAAQPMHAFPSEAEAAHWLAEMAARLVRRMPDPVLRREFLLTLHYEASRSGLDPQLCLGLIQVESNFRKYAVSSAGARGFMQVMPFWVDVIGRPEHNLFHLRTNLRYGCVILRHYLDIERGNLFRALGRYNGSLGQSWYPDLVLRAWTHHWRFDPRGALARAAPSAPGAHASAAPPR
jgi:soluble lytic murein transglycosylase-like protein